MYIEPSYHADIKSKTACKYLFWVLKLHFHPFIESIFVKIKIRIHLFCTFLTNSVAEFCI
jgi:hypothetical protein